MARNTYQVTINWEEADSLTLESLKDAYELADESSRKFLKKAIRYYSTPQQYKDWKNALD